MIYTIEFQKRGLPHAHILLFLERGSKFPTTKDVDKVIRAEIPDRSSNPVLYGLVRDLMVHGPCGLANPSSPCMVKGKCTKKFPKDFCTDTHVNKDGLPVYRRREDGRSVEKNGIELDNRYVIPYNPQLLLKYQGVSEDGGESPEFLATVVVAHFNRSGDSFEQLSLHPRFFALDVACRSVS